MPTVPVPQWTSQQVLPPIDVTNPVSRSRSPYPVLLSDFVRAYFTSWDRCKILDGYLRFRSELHDVGLQDGFQWINGSFTENVETLELRSPGDVDVVTFLSDPGANGQNLAVHLTDHGWVKANRRVDHYWVELDVLTPNQLVEMSAYWYSMWSHRRNAIWKGFLSIDLAPFDDANARHILDNQMLILDPNNLAT